MIDVVAKRYASALADIALKRNEAQRTEADLTAFTEAFYEAPDLRNVLESPAVGREIKQRVIEQIASRMGVDSEVRNLILLIVDHRRTESLRDIQVAFREELNARLGVAEAEVTSARELSDGERSELTNALAKRTGKRIEAKFQQDASLLGGAVVRVGSTVYDGSVREQLSRMRRQLESE